MFKLGDWLEMLKYGVDGVVIDIGLIMVKVCNWDNIIIIIFIWLLVFDLFKNWSGMFVFGGCWIKCSINIDVISIYFLDDDEK